MVDIQYSENKSSDKIRYHPDGFDLSLHLPIDSTKAFDIFADPNQLADLIGDLSRIRQFTPPPVGLGSRWIHRMGLFNEINYIMENTVYEKPVRIVRKRSGVVEGETDIRIEPANIGTVVSISVRTTKFPLLMSKSEYNRILAIHFLSIERKLSGLEDILTPNPWRPFLWNRFGLIFAWILMAGTLVVMLGVLAFIFNPFGSQNQGNEISMTQFLETIRYRPNELLNDEGKKRITIRLMGDQAVFSGQINKMQFHTAGQINLNILQKLSEAQVEFTVQKVWSLTSIVFIIICFFFILIFLVKAKVLLWLVMIAIILQAVFNFFGPQNQGDEISMSMFLEVIQNRSNELLNDKGKKTVKIFLKEDQAIFIGQINKTPFHAIGQINSDILQALSKAQVEYTIQKTWSLAISVGVLLFFPYFIASLLFISVIAVRYLVGIKLSGPFLVVMVVIFLLASLGHWILYIAFFLSMLLIAVSGFIFGFEIIEATVEPPLLLRHRLFAAILGILLACTIIVALKKTVGCMLLTDEWFSARPGVEPIYSTSLILSSPLRYFIVSPSRGEIVCATDEVAAGVENDRYPDAYRFREPEQSLAGLWFRLGFPQKVYTGRIIATPGDIVSIHAGVFSVNGVAVSEVFASTRFSTRLAIELHLGPKDYLLAHDIRDGSDGQEEPVIVVDKKQIFERWTFILIPLSSFGPVMADSTHLPGSPGKQNTSGSIFNSWLFKM